MNSEKKIDKSLLILKTLMKSLSLILFVYIILAFFLKIISLDAQIDPRLFNTNYLKLLVTIGIVGGFIALIISFLQRELNFISIFSLTLKEKIIYFITSIFFSLFYSWNIVVNTQRIILFGLTVILFSVFLPSLIESYVNLNFTDIKHYMSFFFNKTKDSKYKLSLKSIGVRQSMLIFISFLMAGALTMLIVVIITDYFNGKVQKELQLIGQLHITKLRPDKVTYAQKVIIYGYHLGWKENARSKIMSSNGEMPSGLWTNEKAEFIVPLHLKEGARQIWIEKPKDENNLKSQIIMSNKVTLNVESRFDYYPKPEDNFIIRQYKKIKRYFFLNKQ